MTVTIEVGQGLEGSVSRSPTSSLGHLTVAPERLLSWLESQLGLELPSVSFTTRMVQYLACIKQQDKPQRFYHKSLQQDELGVSRTLLQWRDIWYQAGWNGEPFNSEPSDRLGDMADVEVLAMDTVSPGIGQRVQRAMEVLAGTRLDVTVTLLDAADAFPAVWQGLFEQLGATAAPWTAEPKGRPDTDLGALQRALISTHAPGQKIKLSGDGSVLVLRDGSPQLSAPWIARFAQQHLSEIASAVVLAADHGDTLDDALTEAGLPRLGFGDRSFWRPVFQVLPLSLELLWRPLDPAILLQFLTHSIGPIPARIRATLANVVAAQPGIGGDKWVSTVVSELDKAVKDEPEDVATGKREKLAANIDFWLECERFDPQTGIPLPVLKKRVQRLSDWLGSAFAMQEDDAVGKLYSAALGQADELYRAIDRLQQAGETVLAREGVRGLVEAVRGTGATRPGRAAQCAPGAPQLLRADSPAGVIAEAETVIWWGCDKESLPGLYPWSRSEQASLAKNGVNLLPLDTQLEWQADTWLRPLLSASERLVLVLHDNADSHHPVFDQIVAIAEGWVEARVDRIMRDPTALPFQDGLPATQLVPHRTLPVKTRWWQLPAGVSLPARDMESYSSLEKFLHGPHQWVLKYIAGLRAGALVEIDDGARLKGSLAHALFERFFGEHTDIAAIDLARVGGWGQQNLASLMESSGAVLLTPGRQSEKDDFIVTVSRALTELVVHLQSADAVQVVMEHPYEGHFKGGAMQGTIDLHATKANGETAVVDIKWGGFDYRRKTLTQSNYLQLAVYAQLCHQHDKQWPALGYFIIRDARMLVLHHPFFPDAHIVQPDNDESLLEFWQRVETSWQWRRAQLDQGLIEVTVAGTEPDDNSSAGESGLPMAETYDGFDDFTVLTGWSDGS